RDSGHRRTGRDRHRNAANRGYEPDGRSGLSFDRRIGAPRHTAQQPAEAAGEQICQLERGGWVAAQVHAKGDDLMGAVRLVVRAAVMGVLFTLGACADPSAGGKVQLTSKPPGSPDAPATFDVALAAGSTAGAQTAADAIGQRLAACWRAPGVPNAPAVLLRVTLAEDGAVGAVETVEKNRFAADAGYRATATAATRAMLQCGPYTLSGADYAAWK